MAPNPPEIAQQVSQQALDSHSWDSNEEDEDEMENQHVIPGYPAPPRDGPPSTNLYNVMSDHLSNGNVPHSAYPGPHTVLRSRAKDNLPQAASTFPVNVLMAKSTNTRTIADQPDKSLRPPPFPHILDASSKNKRNMQATPQEPSHEEKRQKFEEYRTWRESQGQAHNSDQAIKFINNSFIEMPGKPIFCDFSTTEWIKGGPVPILAKDDFPYFTDF
jgi:hypothetical protein